jgi:predicted house-cleaning noncanonical NTP pyrophosphatase (MazG superfamily)
MRTFRLNKLVRDKIIQLQAADAEVTYKVLKDDEYIRALIAKLSEEAVEMQTSKSSTLLSEIADLQEVIDRIVIAIGETHESLHAKQIAKLQKTGGFDKGYFVETLSLADDDPWVEYYAKDPNRFPEITSNKGKK